MTAPPAFSSLPDATGHFGPYGGRFVAETLVPALHELETAWRAARLDPSFQAELSALLGDYVGRPTALWRARELEAAAGAHGPIYLKREDLAHTGAHKINNCLGQALLTKRLGKRRVIAETGAGQHGVATATAAALLGLECDVYMGTTDMERQAPNVARMKLLGARVRPVDAGTATLKDAMSEALREWVARVRDTHYIIGSTAGPHPYPWMVRELQSVIGREARTQMLSREGRLPDLCVACVGGGSNALGLFAPFVDDEQVRLVGVEAGGHGIASGLHSATLTAGTPGVLHGSRSVVLQDEHGQLLEAHSVAAGLDYPGVGPEHAWLRHTGRATYAFVTDDEALAAARLLARTCGIIPALESSHAIAWVVREARTFRPGTITLVNLSGRGDKDLATLMKVLGTEAAG